MQGWKVHSKPGYVGHVNGVTVHLLSCLRNVYGWLAGVLLRVEVGDGSYEGMVWAECGVGGSGECK